MRVLVVPGYYGFGGDHAAGSSGIGVFFRDQAAALARSGHDVTLLYVHFDRESGNRVEAVNESGFRSIYVHATPWSRFNSVRRCYLMAKAARGIPRNERPEIVHAHVVTSLPGALTVARMLGIPCVVTEHSSQVRLNTLSRSNQLIAKVGYRRADGLSAVSAPLAAAVERWAGRRVRVIPNLVADEFLDVPLRPRDPRRSFTFISVGYSDPIKGWDLLLRAFARSVAQSSALVLVGQASEHMRTLARELGVADRVRFTGKVSRADVMALIQDADCHVMPSRAETFGIASIEALACGKPVVMTATDAAEDIVTPANGLIVAIEDVDSLAGALSQMVSSEEIFNPSLIREACREQFSEAAVTGEYTTLFQDAVLRRGE